MNHSIDPILAFFRGGTDHAGRTLTEILAWSDFQLEHEHDYIQWLFPLSEPSRFNPLAPVLVPTTIAAFDQDPALRQALERGFERLMVFYGFTIQKFPSGDWQLNVGVDFARRSRIWLTPGNHNFLRLTRILTSLRLLGCQPHAEALFDLLDLLYRRHAGVIGRTTYDFWRSAMSWS